ncbi:MAG: Helix-hairpin-helix motif protein [Ignavibacteria bacterium]|nr:MAG: Helix-hairpin-helix motif protein [Ignavibacteria bacterium]KAF0161592.1 MAG: Helix-hairpin-helix motif protein [Ignavibacteria bacterium]
MSKWLEILSRKIGFTKTESQIILFLLAAFSAGFVVNFFNDNSKKSKYLEFDYSAEDSLFNAALGNIEIDDTTILAATEKKVVSKKEVLNFRTDEKGNSKAVTGLVNINAAGIEELMTLPGVGTKTAENILGYRKENGKISNAEELLNIKGIGKAKLAKLREHIKFE